MSMLQRICSPFNVKHFDIVIDNHVINYEPGYSITGYYAIALNGHLDLGKVSVKLVGYVEVKWRKRDKHHSRAYESNQFIKIKQLCQIASSNSCYKEPFNCNILYLGDSTLISNGSFIIPFKLTLPERYHGFSDDKYLSYYFFRGLLNSCTGDHGRIFYQIIGRIKLGLFDKRSTKDIIIKTPGVINDAIYRVK